MKIATLASLWFAAGFAMAVGPAQTARNFIVRVHVESAGWIDPNTDYWLTGPDLMLVPYDPGILET